MSETAIPSRVRVDRNACKSAATCLSYPYYELDDEVIAVLLTENGGNSDDPANPLTDSEGTVRIADLRNPNGLPAEQVAEQVLASAKACPFNAIIVTDADGNQIWPPTDTEPGSTQV